MLRHRTFLDLRWTERRPSRQAAEKLEAFVVSEGVVRVPFCLSARKQPSSLTAFPCSCFYANSLVLHPVHPTHSLQLQFLCVIRHVPA